MSFRVVVLGGYGNFGARIAGTLARDPAMAVTVVCSEPSRAADTAATISLECNVWNATFTSGCLTRNNVSARGSTSWPSVSTDSTRTSFAAAPAFSGQLLTAYADVPLALFVGVGVLAAAQYSSLHPGYLVVFSGIYATPEQAANGLATARAHGFPDAYQIRVTR